MSELDADEGCRLFAEHSKLIAAAWQTGAAFALVVDTPTEAYVCPIEGDTLRQWSTFSDAQIRQLVHGKETEEVIVRHMLWCFQRHRRDAEWGLTAFLIQLGADGRWSSAVGHAFPLVPGGSA